MIDTSRHFVALEKLLNHIDAMRINKFNIMHLHLTDADSFPVEIPQIPELSKYGAYSQDQVYTEQDMVKLQAHARENGVLIIPEFDAPAHTLSWAMSEKYQEINSCGYLHPNQWCQCGYQAPYGTINPIHEKTWEIVKAIVNYTETIFDTDVYHIGADEVKSTCWQNNKKIKYFSEHNGIPFNKLEDWFLKKMVDLYKNKNKKVIYWKVNQISKNLTKSDIFQYWGSQLQFQKDINYKVIVYHSNILYLDCGRGNLFGHTSNWCGKLKTWDFLYQKFNTNSYKLDKENLLGAIAPLWSERVNSDQLDALLYPRTISLALKFWNQNEQLKIQQLAQKIVIQNERLKIIAKIKAGAISSRFCELNINRCFFN